MRPLAAKNDEPETLGEIEILTRCLDAQLVPVRGRQVENRDAPLVAPVEKRNGGADHLVRPEDQRRAAREARIDFFGGRVEADRRELQHAVRGFQLESLGRDVRVVGERAVRHLHAFRHARRTGGVDDVGEVGRIDTDVGVRGIVPRQDAGLAIQSEHQGAGLRWHEVGQLGEQRIARQQHCGLRVLQREGQAIDWIGGVERDIGAACLQHSEERRDHLGRTVQEQADSRVVGHAERHQPPRQLIRRGVEFAVRHRPARRHDRCAVRLTRRLRFERAMNEQRRHAG